MVRHDHGSVVDTASRGCTIDQFLTVFVRRRLALEHRMGSGGSPGAARGGGSGELHLDASRERRKLVIRKQR